MVSIVRRDIMGRVFLLVSLLGVFFTAASGFSQTPPPKKEEVVKKPALVLTTPNSLAIKGEDDLFSMIPTEQIELFKEVLSAYRKGDLERAIAETKTLAKNKTLTQTATALLGDFYFRRWEGAGSSEGMELKDALNALENVLIKYPGTENADLSLLKRGKLYLSRKQYAEASGNFTRVISRHPQTPYAASAEIGLMRSFAGLRRFDKVAEDYSSLSSLNASISNQQRGGLIYANALFELGRFSESYARYQASDALIPGARALKEDLEVYMHYGEAAYRSGHQAEAKEIFKKIYSQFPDDPVAPIALAFNSNIFRKEGATGTSTAQALADRIYFIQTPSPNLKIAKIIAATGRLASLDCPTPCKTETIKQSLKHIEEESKSVFLDRPFSTTAQSAILDGLIQMRRHITFDTAEDLYGEMIPILPVLSPYLPFAESYLRQTVLEHFELLKDPQQAISLYHRFRRAFSADKMNSDIGFKLAKSHQDVGLLSDAIEYYRPVAANVKSPKAEEAFYNIGILLAKMGRFSEAQNILEGFLARYPKRTDVLATLGNVYDVQGKTDLAINAYQKWLGYYPKHSDRKVVYPKLAHAYRVKKELDNQIKTYLRWIAETPEEASRPYIGLADAYYEKKLYANAIQYYDKALKVEKDKKDIDWAKLRLGSSYLALGKKEDAGKVFQQVAKEAKTPIIKKTAREQDAGLQQEKKLLQEVATTTAKKKAEEAKKKKAKE